MPCTLSPVDDPYQAIARFYDRAVGTDGDDLALYEALAGRFGGPVLEIGAGTGRIAVPLARAGVETVAVDASAAMVARGRERAAAAGVEVCWLTGRFEEMTLDRRFGVIFCALDGFLHLTTADAQQHALTLACRALREGGCLALDLPTLASWRDWEPGVRPVELLWSDRCPQTGLTTSHYSTFEAIPSEQVRRITHIFEEIAPDGAVRRWMSSYDLRFVGRFELALLLKRAGLRVTGEYGDYELGALGPESERMIVLAEPAGGGA